MPHFYVKQYYTYADCFDVLADTPEEANEKVTAWFEAQHGPMPDPCQQLDPDVQPDVILTDKNEYIDLDGYTVFDDQGNDVLYD